MRILFIVSDLPEMPVKGYQIRALSFATALRARHSVATAAVAASPTADHVLAPHSKVQQARSLCAVAGRNWPLQTAIFDGPDVAAAAEVFHSRYRPDVTVVVTERLPFTALALANRGPLVLDVVDALASNMSQRAGGAFGYRRALLRHEARAFRRLSETFKARVSHIVASSEREKVCYPNAYIVLNGARSIDETANAEAKFDLVLTGNLQYWANVDAVVELCLRVLPLIREQVPTVRVLVAGATPVARVRELCRVSGVTLHADVPDLRVSLRSARLALAPVSLATGSQIKVMEAISSGLPVLAYPAVIAGLPQGLPGVVSCGGPAEMADAAIRYLRGTLEIPMPLQPGIHWGTRAVEFERVLYSATR